MAIHTFSFKKMHLNLSSTKWWPFYLSLNLLMLHKPQNSVYHIPICLQLLALPWLWTLWIVARIHDFGLCTLPLGIFVSMPHCECTLTEGFLFSLKCPFFHPLLFAWLIYSIDAIDNFNDNFYDNVKNPHDILDGDGTIDEYKDVFLKNKFGFIRNSA